MLPAQPGAAAGQLFLRDGGACGVASGITDREDIDSGDHAVLINGRGIVRGIGSRQIICENHTETIIAQGPGVEAVPATGGKGR